VQEKLSEMPLMEQDPNLAARCLVDRCLEKGLISDNITVIISTFNRGIEKK
jgi:serine/threonine protein phosphatase PrpC